MILLFKVVDLIYLWYKHYHQHCGYKDIEEATKHCSISIEVVAQQYRTNNHDDHNDSSDIDDQSNVFGIIENIYLNLPRFEGQYHCNQLCYEEVGIENNNPY